MKYRQEIIRDKEFRILEEIDINNKVIIKHVIYDHMETKYIDSISWGIFNKTKASDSPEETLFIYLIKDLFIMYETPKNYLFKIIDKNLNDIFTLNLYGGFRKLLVSSSFWSKFETKFGMTHKEIKEFLKIMLGKYFLMDCINEMKLWR